MDKIKREARVAQLVDSYGAHGLAMMLIEAEEQLETVKKSAPQGINLTAAQLREALYWANPDNTESEEDTEVRIEWLPKLTSTDGEEMAAGDYLHYIDCPEEGVIGPLGEDPVPDSAKPRRAISDVLLERLRQDSKWGGIEHDDQHEPFFWCQLIQDYAGWARVMAGMDSPEKYRRRMIQVAALACAAVESHDRLIRVEDHSQ